MISMWWNIIKESRQTSRTMGSIDWENEEVPDEEETKCKKKLKEIYERAVKKKEKHGMFGPAKREDRVSIGVILDEEFFNTITEKDACKALELFSNLGGSPHPQEFTSKDGMKFTGQKHLEGEYPLLSLDIRVLDSEGYGHEYYVGSLTYYKKTKEKWIEITKEIFGEYY